jgi:hypothetical protein
LEAKIPATYELESEDIEFDLNENVRMNGRSVELEVTASAQLIADVDRRAVRSTVAGLPPAEATEELVDSFALESQPDIEVQPDWIKRWEWLDRVPFLPFRIQVVVLEP